MEWDGGHSEIGPVVKAIVTGPMAVSRYWPSPMRSLLRLAYRFLGVNRKSPSEIPWKSVASISVLVELQKIEDPTGADVLSEAVRRRFISRIPGS